MEIPLQLKFEMEGPNNAEIVFALEGTTSENQSSGLVTITSSSSSQVIETEMVGTCQTEPNGFGFTLEWEHTFSSGQALPFYSVVTY